MADWLRPTSHDFSLNRQIADMNLHRAFTMAFEQDDKSNMAILKNIKNKPKAPDVLGHLLNFDLELKNL